MDKIELARYLSGIVRGIYKKHYELKDITGFYLVDFIDEVEDLEDFIVDLLEPTPWEGCRMIIHEYMWGRSDDTFDEVVEKVNESKLSFDEEEFLKFVEDYEHLYGKYPYGRDLIEKS